MKKIIGLTEIIVIKGNKGRIRVTAKIDTGSYNSSICKSLLEKIDSSKPIRKVRIRTAVRGFLIGRKQIRPLIRLKIKDGKRWILAGFSVSDRAGMRYKVLIGRKTLRKMKVLIDTNR